MIIEVSRSNLAFRTIEVILIWQEQHRNRLDQNLFPYVKDAPEVAPQQRTASPFLSVNSAAPPASGSLRSARPTWHKAPSARMTNTEGKQRIILFIAGGVTYSEMRLAYTVGQQLGKDVYIGTSPPTEMIESNAD